MRSKSYDYAYKRALKVFTAEMDDIIRQNYQTLKDTEIAQILDPYVSCNIDRTMVSLRRNQLGLKKDNMQFKNGHIPKNKGTRKPKAKKEPKERRLPLGAEKKDKDGYIKVKVAQPSKYVYKSKLVWEEANGKIPRGKQILFLDQNKENVTLENMILVDKNLMGTINKIYKLSSDKDINKAIVTLAKLERDINDRR